MSHGTGMIPEGGMLYGYSVHLMGYYIFFTVHLCLNWRDIMTYGTFSPLFLGRISCVFLSLPSCVSTWRVLLCVATNGSRKSGSSPALCPSVHSTLRWVSFYLQCVSDMEIAHRCSHGVCTGDWFLRSIIMLVRIWLTVETPLLLLDFTERQSGKSIFSASCYTVWVLGH